MNDDGNAGMRRLPDDVVRSEKIAGAPLFTSLPADAATRLAAAVSAWEAEPGAVVVREGDVSDSVYVVVDGAVRVEHGGAVVVRLGAGELFGEMALLGNRPRAATVVADVATTLLELPRAALDQLRVDEPRVGAALERVCRERLIDNLARTSALFGGIDAATARSALAGFAEQKTPARTIVVREGEPGPGLFVVLDGALAVTANGTDGTIPLKELGAGDVFGEMSLLGDDTATATVTTTAACTLLALPRAAFHEFAAGHPALKARLAQLASQRRASNEVVTGYLPDETTSAIMV